MLSHGITGPLRNTGHHRKHIWSPNYGYLPFLTNFGEKHDKPWKKFYREAVMFYTPHTMLPIV